MCSPRTGEHISLNCMFADVIVDIDADGVDKIFEYSFDDCRIIPGSRVRVPFGKRFIDGYVIRLKENSDLPSIKIRPVFSLIEDVPAITAENLLLAEYIKKTCFVTYASAIRLFLPAEMRRGKVREKFERYVKKVEDFDGDATASIKKTAKNQIAFVECLKANGKIRLAEANERFGSSSVKSVIEKGLAEVVREQVQRLPYAVCNSIKKTVTLTDAQLAAVQSFVSTEKTVSLMFGVTGSGKTEVYLELIDRTITSGKTAIMLVPEISLTPQMLKQLRARFGSMAAILHSGLSAGERYDEWWRLRSGDAKIAIGARSAIFAPLENLGLIVIDEEHDGSYVSESSPRYSTIDVAKKRAEICRAKIILGSATPSIESYLAAQTGSYNFITLPERINGKALPQIEIVDMRKEVRRGNASPFSTALRQEIAECLNNGNQAMIFLNQRGYSKSVICTECGHVQRCPSCDVSLTYHKEDESLLCHYCGAKFKMIDACTECGSKYIRYGGVGTERVVDELKKIFPTAKILRMDRDTTRSKSAHFNILEEFSARKADILVGTQMIAKGHDFPSVTLVGILDADMSLHFSDFRSGERTFQLLTQVAGRSGRAGEAGKVVLQTYSPENETLRLAVNYDYEGMYSHELSVRKATSFPPFSKIVRVLVSSASDEKALEVTKLLYNNIKTVYDAEREYFRFFGCMKAPLKKLQNKFRYQILMRILPGRDDIINRVFTETDKYNNGAVSAYIEINPNNLS